jgi:hypothetical protein
MSLFDLRVPLGWLFVILGILLEIAGLHPTPTSEGMTSNINVNLIWGAVMFAFGLICLWLARLSKRKLARENQTVRPDNP